MGGKLAYLTLLFDKDAAAPQRHSRTTKNRNFAVTRFVKLHLVTFGIAVASLFVSVTSTILADDKKPADNQAPSAKPYAGYGGDARRAPTNSEEAQKWFNQGIQLLYGFNQDEAIRAFEKAAEIDHSCAMALWGASYGRGIHINNPEMGEEQSRLAHESA